MSTLQPLLQALACGDNKIDVADYNQAEISWLCRCGLAPAFKFVAADQAALAASVMAGDLEAKVVSGILHDALAELLAAAGPASDAITLLKGISLSEDVYPRPHLRTMGDLDVLVEVGNQAWLEQLLCRLGYVQRSELPEEFYAEHCHSMPFHHPTKPVCVEVHTALFPGQMDVASGPAFKYDRVLSQRHAGLFRGYAITRLSPELQIPYVCTHMVERLTFAREPMAILDLVLLLRQYGDTLAWGELSTSTRGTPVANHVYVLLSYLAARDLVTVPATVMKDLRAGSHGVAWINMAILHRILDRYLLSPPVFEGVVTDWTVRLAWKTLLQYQASWLNFAQIPWNVVFVPNHPQRYSWRFHWWRLRSWVANRKNSTREQG